MDPQLLIDLHARAHTILKGLFDHCRAIDAGALDREYEGCGESYLWTQLCHALTAKRYRIAVLQGRSEADNDIEVHPDRAFPAALREKVFAATQAHLRGAAVETMGTQAEFDTWGREGVALVPDHVLLRTATHAYHHLGQSVAMCRLLGNPIPGFNHPIT